MKARFFDKTTGQISYSDQRVPFEIEPKKQFPCKLFYQNNVCFNVLLLPAEFQTVEIQTEPLFTGASYKRANTGQFDSGFDRISVTFD